MSDLPYPLPYNLASRAEMLFISGPGVTGIAERGRRTRPEMIGKFRDYYARQLAEAELALATPSSELVVETYLGIHSERNRQVVTEAEPS